MKSIFTVIGIALCFSVSTIGANAAPKFDERWQEIQKKRYERFVNHRKQQVAPAAVQNSTPKAKIVVAAKPIKKKKAGTVRHLGRVEARVDISEQKMRVYSNGRLRYTWPVSTARRGKVTPTGTWTAKWLSKNHRSSRYNGAPMPYSIFYSGNFAVHGTNQIKRLGSPASAGCVRLHPDNAKVLFRMAQNVGLKNLKIRVTR